MENDCEDLDFLNDEYFQDLFQDTSPESVPMAENFKVDLNSIQNFATATMSTSLPTAVATVENNSHAVIMLSNPALPQAELVYYFPPGNFYSNFAVPSVEIASPTSTAATTIANAVGNIATTYYMNTPEYYKALQQDQCFGLVTSICNFQDPNAQVATEFEYARDVFAVKYDAEKRKKAVQRYLDKKKRRKWYKNDPNNEARRKAAASRERFNGKFQRISKLSTLT